MSLLSGTGLLANAGLRSNSGLLARRGLLDRPATTSVYRPATQLNGLSTTQKTPTPGTTWAYMQTRTLRNTTGAKTSIFLRIPGFYVNSNAVQTANGDSYRVRASIEYPIGATPQQFTLLSSADMAIPSNTLVQTDALTLALPALAQYKLHYYVDNVVGGITKTTIPIGRLSTISALGVAQGVTVTDKTATIGGETTASASPANLPWPMFIGGSTISGERAVAVFGDSITFGFNENNQQTSDSFGRVGPFERWLGNYDWGCVNNGVSSTKASQWAAIAANAPLVASNIADTCSDALVALGRNDLANTGDLPALISNIQLLNIYCRTVLGFPAVVTTVTPKATSTDSFATTANQTPVNANANRITYNDGPARVGPLTLRNAFLEVASNYESATDSGVWHAASQGGIFTQAQTSDGLHPDGVNATAQANVRFATSYAPNPSTVFFADSLGADSTPNAFAFTPVTGATVAAAYTSNSITVSGIDTYSPISVTGGTYSVNGGSSLSAASYVTNGDVVTVGATASSSFSTEVDVVLTIGGVSATYAVTTGTTIPLVANYDFSNSGAVTVNGSQQITAMADSVTSANNLTQGGTLANITYVSAAQNGHNVARLVRTGTGSTNPRLGSVSTSPVSQLVQGLSKPWAMILAFKPTDTNSRLPSGWSHTVDATNYQAIYPVSRNGSASEMDRRVNSTTANPQTWGSGQASGTPRTMLMYYDGTKITVYDNDMVTPTINAVTQSTTTMGTGLTLYLGCQEVNGASSPTYNAAAGNMDIYQLMVLDASTISLATALIQAAERKTFWGT